MRAIRTAEYLYVRNYAPDRHPGLDIDAGPSKDVLMDGMDRPGYKRFVDMWFNPRPVEELYRIEDDPDQTKNLADSPEQAAVLTTLRDRMDARLERAQDPRHTDRRNVFDSYRYFGGPTYNVKRVGPRFGVRK